MLRAPLKTLCELRGDLKYEICHFFCEALAVAKARKKRGEGRVSNRLPQGATEKHPLGVSYFHP